MMHSTNHMFGMLGMIDLTTMPTIMRRLAALCHLDVGQFLISSLPHLYSNPFLGCWRHRHLLAVAGANLLHFLVPSGQPV